MSATPQDVARFTNDGYLLRTDPAVGAAILAAHPDAKPAGDSEIEMYWVNPDHAQIVLDEKFAIRSTIDPLHEGIEVDEALGLGTTIALAPVVPSFLIVDDTRAIDQTCRTRSYAHDTATDRFALEILE